MKPWFKLELPRTWPKLALPQLPGPQRKPGATLLGLSLESGRLEGVFLRRTNGSIEVGQHLSAPLSLDPLTNPPELVGREIRKQLTAAGIRERRCAVCLPLSWALTLTVPLPDLPEPDLASFLQIEAERGFPHSPDALWVAHSRFRTPAGTAGATLVAVPRDHVARLEAALQAAQLRPVSFSLGLAALQPPEADTAGALLSLAPGETHLGLQITCGGGIVTMRAVTEAFEVEGGTRQLQIPLIAREIRVTLGQLSPPVRDTLRRLRVFGRNETAAELVEQLAPRLASLGITLEAVRDYGPADFGVTLPAGTPVSPALSLAARHLAGHKPDVEFLPPRTSAWQQLTQRHASRRFAAPIAIAGALLLIVALAFLVQQWQLMRWTSRWNVMRPRALELEAMQQQIKQCRPWYDESFRSLSILRRLTEAFPIDGTVSAKSIAIRELATITCAGTARDNQALLKTLDQLRAATNVSRVQVEQIRGKSPMQFTINFQWGDAATYEH